MLTGHCRCGAEVRSPASEVGRPLTCGGCGGLLRFVGSPPEGEAAATGTILVRFAGGPGTQPTPSEEQYLLIGDAAIEIGKSDGKPIRLPGTKVSRSHCQVVRDGDGWRIEDVGSRNGTHLNGARVEMRRLWDGDRLHVGEFRLDYSAAAQEELVELEEAPTVADVPRPAKPKPVGPTCPSCKKELPLRAKICVSCGIDIKSGKSLITSRGFDDDKMAAACDAGIRIASWLIPVGLYPIASEAHGPAKPKAVRTIAIATVIISILFAFAINADWGGFKNLMLWSGNPKKALTVEDYEDRAEREIDRQVARMRKRGEHVPASAAAQARRDAREDARQYAETHPDGTFSPHQLLTNAFLHDSSGFLALVGHLGINMLFFLVLGSAVNSLIGNPRTWIIYPILAVVASIAEYLDLRAGRPTFCVGASGAVMGMAGMYLVLFPVHRVFMAFWVGIRVWCWYKVWPLRGFWVVGFFIMFDVTATIFGSGRDGIGHWAHLGGFLAGIAIALLLLLTRQVDANGGDILTRLLGRRAWLLLGTPEQRAARRT